MNNFDKIDSGTYAAIQYSQDTCESIEILQKLLNVPFPVPKEKLHTTICYSRKWIPYSTEDISGLEIGTACHLEIFKGEKNALVLVIDSDYCKMRHEYANILGATYDFPDYIPHITLSYDVGELKFNDVVTLPPLIAKCEYVEDLDLNWKT